MATSPEARRVEALRRTQSDLRKKVAKSASDVAFNMGKVADCRTAAAKSRSTVTTKSKMRQADQHEAKAITAERTRAKLESEGARQTLSSSVHGSEISIQAQTAKIIPPVRSSEDLEGA